MALPCLGEQALCEQQVGQRTYPRWRTFEDMLTP
jgi:hypothetical protein